MPDIIDLLQIKIEKAKAQLSDGTLNAIAAVPWRDIILRIKERRGYSLEQLGDLELETELVLCGLLNPEDYQKELESRMRLNKVQGSELVNEMNEQVFSKIKEELIKSTERKDAFSKNSPSNSTPLNFPLSGGTSSLDKGRPGGIVFSSPSPSQGEGRGEVSIPPPKPSILEQKLSGSVQSGTVKTDHSLNNITPSNTSKDTPKVDPYREVPE